MRLSPRLVVVNDRSFFEPGGADATRGTVDPGGLATALTRDDFRHKVFVSSARGPAQRALAARGAVGFDAGDRRFLVRLVASPEPAYRAFYDIAANDLLWLLHHGRWPGEVGPAQLAAYRDGYRVVNAAVAAAVADQVAAEAATGDRVHVLWQDYQFYLAPALARQALPPSTSDSVVFQHFLHVPFPDPADWARLPAAVGAELLHGLLGNDLVCFQLDRYAQRFLACCRRLPWLTVDGGTVRLPGGRVVRVASRPIPATPEHLTATAAQPATRELAAALRRRTGDRRLIFRTERIDPVKDFPAAMRAYELLLRRPGMAGTVVYAAQLVPARQGIPRFAAERDRAERAAHEVNRRHGTAGWQPVDLVVRRDFPGAVAGYLGYDALDVLPWADGMNLVALEGPLVNERDGALVLASTAGAHELLAPHAIGVPPGDPDRHADALHTALTLPPAERAHRAAALRTVARRGDPAAWLTDQVATACSTAR